MLGRSLIAVAIRLLVLPFGNAKPLVNLNPKTLLDPNNYINGAMYGLPNLSPMLSSNTYDYIVIGAGTGGYVVATRLSETGASVLVIEAGIDVDTSTINEVLKDLPGGDTIGAGSSSSDFLQNAIDWNFFTQPQAGANNRKVRYARGKCAGGSSNRNFMIYQRPTVGSMTKWQQLTGDSSWGFNERKADFMKSMTFTAPRHDLRREIPQAQFDPSDFAQQDPKVAPLAVSYPNFAQNFSKYMMLSANELGTRSVTSFNGGSLLGVQYSSATINGNGGRRSTSRTFYDVGKTRGNFKMFFKTYAKRVLFEKNPNGPPRAAGVIISTNYGGSGATSSVYARKEVIVSAGAFQSPQILMASGIGPKDQLNKFNIAPVAINENVGKNMQDHIFIGPTYPVDPATGTLTDIAANPIYLAAQLANFTAHQLGPLTNNVADLLSWEKVSGSSLGAPELDTYPADWPTIEGLSAPGVTGDFSNLLTENLQAGIGGRRFASILFALVAPQSRGTVTLNSGDTADAPLIDPAWMTHPTDQKVALYAFKRARQYFATQAMRPVLAGDEYLPGPNVQSDDQIMDWIRNNLMTVWHAACTCSMKKKELGGVLDSRLRVYDVTGLRVVDASSFPMLPPGHPQSVVYMLAERASDLIKQDNQ